MIAPLVSLVVPSRGGAQRLPRLIKALEAQTNSNWEAIIVLDGDVDDSERVVESLAAELPIRTIIFPENRGRSAALNAGFRESIGSIIARCDDDLIPETDYIETLIDEHGKGVAGIIGLYKNVYPSTPYARAYGDQRDRMFRETAYRTPMDENWRYWAGNASVPRTIYERVGDYDLAFRAYGFEDVDMGYRIHQAGFPIRLVTRLETPHHIAATTTVIRVRRAFHSGAARRRFDTKHQTSHAPRGESSGVWMRAVTHVGHSFGRSSFERAARLVDRCIPALPKYVSEKAISFLVESSSISGYAHADDIDLAV